MLKKLLPVDVTPAIKAEQVRLLYHQGGTIVALGIFTALVAVMALWSVAEHTLLIGWFIATVMLSLGRFYLTYRFSRIAKSDFAIDTWADRYIIGTFLAGLLWGSLSFLYDPSWPAAHQVILFAIYTGIIAGSMNSNSSVFVAFPAFYLPAVSCLLFVMLYQQNETFFELIILFIIYAVLMYVSALKYNARLANALQLRFENEQLAKNLVISNKVLAELAEKDELTQLSNRRSMDNFLEKVWNVHLQAQLPLSVLFIDIDHFKEFNDTYGHHEGDKCLVAVANTLQHNTRNSGDDMAARYGGEEFAIILSHTKAEDAYVIAKRIHADVIKLGILHQGSPVHDCVTLSIGIATMVPDDTHSAETLWQRADDALYQAKRNGRNQIVTYHADQP